jgi:hypothetical protein
LRILPASAGSACTTCPTSKSPTFSSWDIFMIFNATPVGEGSCPVAFNSSILYCWIINACSVVSPQSPILHRNQSKFIARCSWGLKQPGALVFRCLLSQYAGGVSPQHLHSPGRNAVADLGTKTLASGLNLPGLFWQDKAIPVRPGVYTPSFSIPPFQGSHRIPGYP